MINAAMVYLRELHVEFSEMSANFPKAGDPRSFPNSTVNKPKFASY